jgi:hypothetical protein
VPNEAALVTQPCRGNLTLIRSRLPEASLAGRVVEAGESIPSATIKAAAVFVEKYV